MLKLILKRSFNIFFVYIFLVILNYNCYAFNEAEQIYTPPVEIIGVGGFTVCYENGKWSIECPFNSNSRVPITEFLKENLPNVNAISLWLTRDFQEEWYPVDIINNNFIKQGYIPIFILYYYADGVSNIPYVEAEENNYYAYINKVVNYISKIKGKKLVILEPEFNQYQGAIYEGWNRIFGKAIEILRKDKTALIGLGVGDFGRYEKVYDIEEWELFKPAIKDVYKFADFISFVEMRLSPRDSAEGVLKMGERAYNFAKYLYNTYKKPIMIGYIGISSFNNFENIQKQALENLLIYYEKLKTEMPFMGINYFILFDDIKKSGSERYYGLIYTNGKIKPAFFSFKKFDIIISHSFSVPTINGIGIIVFISFAGILAVYYIKKAKK